LVKDLSELLGWADIVSLHCQPEPDGSPVLGQQEFAWMKDDVVLVNTARGSLVDEEALYSALLDKPKRFAALDVFAVEPYQGKLALLPNVIATPHVASATLESRAQMELESVVNCLKGLQS
jgi:phosphoglycerate dehydrogenase-like enzyme